MGYSQSLGPLVSEVADEQRRPLYIHSDQGSRNEVGPAVAFFYVLTAVCRLLALFRRAPPKRPCPLMGTLLISEAGGLPLFVFLADGVDAMVGGRSRAAPGAPLNVADD